MLQSCLQEDWPATKGQMKSRGWAWQKDRQATKTRWRADGEVEYPNLFFSKSPRLFTIRACYLYQACPAEHSLMCFLPCPHNTGSGRPARSIVLSKGGLFTWTEDLRLLEDASSATTKDLTTDEFNKPTDDPNHHHNLGLLAATTKLSVYLPLALRIMLWIQSRRYRPVPSYIPFADSQGLFLLPSISIDQKSNVTFR